VPQRSRWCRFRPSKGPWPAPNELIWVVVAVDAVDVHCVVDGVPVEATSSGGGGGGEGLVDRWQSEAGEGKSGPAELADTWFKRRFLARVWRAKVLPSTFGRGAGSDLHL